MTRAGYLCFSFAWSVCSFGFAVICMWLAKHSMIVAVLPGIISGIFFMLALITAWVALDPKLHSRNIGGRS